MNYFFLFSFFVILITGYSFFKKYEKGISVFFIFSLFASIYYLGIPIELILFNTSIVNSDIILPQNHIESIMLMGILSITGFGMGYYLSAYRLKLTNVEKETVKNHTTIRSIYFLAISIAIAIFALFSEEIRNSFLSYKGNFTTTYNNSLYAYSKECFFFSVSVVIVFLSNKKLLYKIIAVILTIILVAFGIFSSDKDPMLLAVIAWVVFFTRKMVDYNLNKIRVSLILFFISVIIIPLCSNYFSYYRGGGLLQMEDIKEKGLYRMFESAGPMESLVTVLDDSDLEYQWGRTYIWGLISWIPKSVWADRPMNLAEKFAKEKIKNWEPGRGLGFSLLAEAYINFGVLGAFIQYFMIGLMIGGLGIFTRWIFKREQTLFADSIFFIWMVYTLVIMHRGPFDIPSSYIRFILPFIFYYFIFDYNDGFDRLCRKIVKK